MKRTIVILANSLKNNHHCVAGKDINTKKWVRIVNNAEGGELSDEQAKCKNPYGVFDINVLQKIEMNLSQPAPLINQPENYIKQDEIWIQRYKIEENELNFYIDNPKVLWSNESSSRNGQNDRVDYNQIINGNPTIDQSLYLIKVNGIRIFIFRNSENRKRIRISFVYKNINYNLATTDPNFMGKIFDYRKW